MRPFFRTSTLQRRCPLALLVCNWSSRTVALGLVSEGQGPGRRSCVGYSLLHRHKLKLSTVSSKHPLVTAWHKLQPVSSARRMRKRVECVGNKYSSIQVCTEAVCLHQSKCGVMKTLQQPHSTAKRKYSVALQQETLTLRLIAFWMHTERYRATKSTFMQLRAVHVTELLHRCWQCPFGKLPATPTGSKLC